MSSFAAPRSALYAATLLRVSLAVMWIAHGLLKWVVFTLPGSAAFFESVGLPGFLAYVVTFTEIGGGIAMLLGVYARQIALALVPIVLGAAWVHFPNGWVFTAPNGGWEYPVFLALMSVVSWLLGDGLFALRRSARLAPAA
ncbi:MAG TPA: DoxX family protein [Lysobacter sp.]|nr:DoxX family protein [Lysobacter sp.]